MFTSNLSEALEISLQARVVFSTNFPFNVVYVNKKWIEITGYDEVDILDQPLRFLKIKTNDITSNPVNITGSGQKECFYLMNKKSREIICLSFSITPIIQSNQIIYFLGILNLELNNIKLLTLENQTSSINGNNWESNILDNRTREDGITSDEEDSCYSADNDLED